MPFRTGLILNTAAMAEKHVLGHGGIPVNHKPRERDKYLIQAEFRRLMRWADHNAPPGARLFLFLGGAVGLRIGEARLVRWRDLARVRTDRVVEVRALKKRREMIADVAIDTSSAERIVDYIKAMGGPGRPDDPVFRSARGGMLSLRQANRWMKAAVRGAGLNRAYSYHALRHYRGISLWAASKNIELVKRQLRHENASTTYKYMHMSDEEQRANVEKVEVL